MHQTSSTIFLSKSTWNEKLLIKSLILELICNKSKETKKPIYFIIDDTISEKTKL